ncbi:Uncharacterized protein Adt_03876 [Abeliophyllum distichum]|uniref:Uncharacterized protein n=1 Tax=Abeliophyllum distichum TaxID=126358 RepID=A0ABD1W256_9LAMI
MLLIALGTIALEKQRHQCSLPLRTDEAIVLLFHLDHGGSEPMGVTSAIRERWRCPQSRRCRRAMVVGVMLHMVLHKIFPSTKWFRTLASSLLTKAVTNIVSDFGKEKGAKNLGRVIFCRAYVVFEDKPFEPLHIGLKIEVLEHCFRLNTCKLELKNMADCGPLGSLINL